MVTVGSRYEEKSYTGIQFGFEWNTEAYREWNATYGNETVVYYQFRTGAHAEQLRVVPDGCVDLLFACDPGKPLAIVCGSVLSGQSILFVPDAVYFGVRLTPGLSMRLPKLSLRELVEVQAPLALALPEFRHLASHMAEQPDFRARIRCFETHAMQLLRSDPSPAGLVDYCLSELQRTRGTVAVRDLAEHAGYSERYLRTRFEDALGISPKTYGRIVRFQHALRAIMTEHVPFTELVARHGYYDQAHFVKEFKAFSQLTPLQMQREKERMTDLQELQKNPHGAYRSYAASLY